MIAPGHVAASGAASYVAAPGAASYVAATLGAAMLSAGGEHFATVCCKRSSASGSAAPVGSSGALVR